MPSESGDFSLGIDPGIDGAIALIRKISDTKFDLIKAIRLPMDVEDNLSVHTFTSLVQTFATMGGKSVPITVEQAIASKFVFLKGGQKRHMSADSAWRVGFNYGRLTASLQLARIPFSTVLPRSWTAVLHRGLPKEFSSKQKSLSVFNGLCSDNTFAQSIPQRCKVPHSGIIDATLIAWWALSTRTQ